MFVVQVSYSLCVLEQRMNQAGHAGVEAARQNISTANSQPCAWNQDLGDHNALALKTQHFVASPWYSGLIISDIT